MTISVTKVADLLVHHRIRRILVLEEENGKLAGLVSRRDLLKAARRAGKAIAERGRLGRNLAATR